MSVMTPVPQNLRGALLSEYEARLAHFARRARALGRDPSELVIVLLEVDDAVGGALAEALMPGHDWGPIRARGERPVALGLAGKRGVAEVVSRVWGAEWASKLDDVPAASVAVCVIADMGVMTARVDLANVGPGGDA